MNCFCAANAFLRREILMRPLAGQSSRTIRLASRPGFPRPQALRALEKVIRKSVTIALLRN
jgi:LysR family hydrogen peroxide-inducible transcriptional activator